MKLDIGSGYFIPGKVAAMKLVMRYAILPQKLIKPMVVPSDGILALLPQA